MNVKECMSGDPRTVRTTDRLDAAARVLWEHDCGFVPVVDAVGGLVGVLTDRDLCMASYTQGRSLGEIAVTAAMARQVRVVRADESVAAALAAMQEMQVHRLPVVDAQSRPVGVISTNDLVRAAVARPAAVDGGQVLRTLAAIGRPRHAVAADESTKVVAPALAKGEAAKAVTAAAGDSGAQVPKKSVAAPKAPRKAAKPAARGRSRKG